MPTSSKKWKERHQEKLCANECHTADVETSFKMIKAEKDRVKDGPKARSPFSSIWTSLSPRKNSPATPRKTTAIKPRNAEVKADATFKKPSLDVATVAAADSSLIDFVHNFDDSSSSGDSCFLTGGTYYHLIKKYSY